MISHQNFNPYVLEEINLAEEFIDLLSGITQAQAICAGGAPRDWFFNKPCADIDIFMETPKDIPKLLSFISSSPNIQRIKSVCSSDLSQYYRKPYINRVISFKYKKKDFQIIILTPNYTLDTLVYNFDCYMSYIVLKEGFIKPYPEFLEGVYKAQLIFKSSLSVISRFFNKYKTYFPNYQVIYND